MHALSRVSPGHQAVEQSLAALATNGAVILEQIASSATLDRLVAEVDPASFGRFGSAGFSGARTRRTSGLVAKSNAAVELMMQPVLLEIASRWLVEPEFGKRFPGFATSDPTIQLSATQLIEVFPGAQTQPLHRDDVVHRRSHPGPDSQVQAFFAVNDCTVANGATRVVPGSHRWDDVRQPQAHEVVQAEMPRGSALVLLGSTIHGAGANETDNEVRQVAIIGFCLGYLRQEENQYLAVPKERVMELPAPVQDLLGWAVSPPFCGWLDGGEPSAILSTR